MPDPAASYLTSRWNHPASNTLSSAVPPALPHAAHITYLWAWPHPFLCQCLMTLVLSISGILNPMTTWQVGLDRHYLTQWISATSAKPPWLPHICLLHACKRQHHVSCIAQFHWQLAMRSLGPELKQLLCAFGGVSEKTFCRQLFYLWWRSQCRPSPFKLICILVALVQSWVSLMLMSVMAAAWCALIPPPHRVWNFAKSHLHLPYCFLYCSL